MMRSRRIALTLAALGVAVAAATVARVGSGRTDSTSPAPAASPEAAGTGAKRSRPNELAGPPGEPAPRLAPSRRVRVGVRGPDGPLAGATIRVRARTGPDEGGGCEDVAAGTTTDEAGGATIEVAEAARGALLVRVSCPGYRTHLERVEESATPLAIVLDRVASLDGRVVEAASGAPVAGALVAGSLGLDEVKARTDADGWFRLPATEADLDTTLAVSAEGFVEGDLHVVRMGGRVVLSPIVARLDRVEALGRLRGTLHDRRGAAVEGGVVVVVEDGAPWPDGFLWCIRGEGQVGTDGTGSFEVRGLPLGRALRVAFDDGAERVAESPEAVVIDAVGRVATVDLRQGGSGTVVVTIVGPDGAPVADAAHVFIDVRATHVYAGALTYGRCPSSVSSEGVCTFEDAAEGRHAIEVRDPRWRSGRATVVVRRGQTARAEIRLKSRDEGVRFTGMVFDESGRGVAGAAVVSGGGSTTTDASGRFELAADGDPPYRLVAELPLPDAVDSAGSELAIGGFDSVESPAVYFDTPASDVVLRIPDRPRVRFRVAEEAGVAPGPTEVAAEDGDGGRRGARVEGVEGAIWTIGLDPRVSGAREILVRSKPEGGPATGARIRVAPAKGTATDAGTIRFAKLVDVRVLVLDEQGRPVSGSWVNADDEGGAFSSEAGEGVVEQVVPGPTIVQAEGYGGIDGETAAEVADGMAPVVVRLRAPGLATGRVLSLAGEPLARRKVMLNHLPGRGIDRGYDGSTDESGRFAALLAPGRWMAFVEVPGARYFVSVGEFDVASGGTTEVALTSR